MFCDWILKCVTKSTTEIQLFLLSMLSLDAAEYSSILFEVFSPGISVISIKR